MNVENTQTPAAPVIGIGSRVRFIYGNCFFEGIVVDAEHAVLFVAVVGHRSIFCVARNNAVPLP